MTLFSLLFSTLALFTAAQHYIRYSEFCIFFIFLWLYKRKRQKLNDNSTIIIQMQAIIQGFSYSSVVGIIVAPLKLSPGFSGLENGALVDITLSCLHMSHFISIQNN